jgi:hypothetical protein
MQASCRRAFEGRECSTNAPGIGWLGIAHSGEVPTPAKKSALDVELVIRCAKSAPGGPAQRDGPALEIFNMHEPFDSSKNAMEWDGWHIRYEVFRDLGVAFAAVLVMIYILVVSWFQSFITPITNMLAVSVLLVFPQAPRHEIQRRAPRDGTANGE